MFNKITTSLGALALTTALAVPVIAAPSSKFTAVVDKTYLSTEATRDATGTTDPDPVIRAVVATLKVPSQKELLIQVSAQIAIDTNTSVKGKNGGGGTANAKGSAVVQVEVCNVASGACEIAEPGAITFAAREQELSATLGGVIEDCTDINGDGTIDVDTECTVTDEEIALLLKTTAAHHYNFIAANLSAGTYTIEATFSADASATTLDVGDGGANFAAAEIVVGPTVTVVEEVRATNNPDGVVIID